MSEPTTAAVQEAPRNPFAEAPNSKKMLILLAVFIGVCANIMVSTTNSTVLVAAANEIGGMEIYPFVNSIAGILGVCIIVLRQAPGFSIPLTVSQEEMQREAV